MAYQDMYSRRIFQNVRTYISSPKYFSDSFLDFITRAVFFQNICSRLPIVKKFCMIMKVKIGICICRLRKGAFIYVM